MVKILRGNDGHLLTSEQQNSEIPIAAIAQRKLRFSMIFLPDFLNFRLPRIESNRLRSRITETPDVSPEHLASGNQPTTPWLTKPTPAQDNGSPNPPPQPQHHLFYLHPQGPFVTASGSSGHTVSQVRVSLPRPEKWLPLMRVGQAVITRSNMSSL